MATPAKTSAYRKPSNSSSASRNRTAAGLAAGASNYIYGTFLVLRGLEAIGFDQHEPQVQQAAESDSHGAEP